MARSAVASERRSHQLGAKMKPETRKSGVAKRIAGGARGIPLMLYLSHHHKRRCTRVPRYGWRFAFSTQRHAKNPASSFARSQSCFSNRLTRLSNSVAFLFRRNGSSTTSMHLSISRSWGSSGFSRSLNSLLRRRRGATLPYKMASCALGACLRMACLHSDRSAVTCFGHNPSLGDRPRHECSKGHPKKHYQPLNDLFLHSLASQCLWSRVGRRRDDVRHPRPHLDGTIRG